MMKHFACGFVLLLLSLTAIPGAWGSPQEKPLVFGFTPVVLDTDFTLVSGFLKYLENQMGIPIVPAHRKTYKEILGLLKYGEVDFAWICGYPFISNQKDLELVSVPIFQGKPYYQSYLIVARSAPYSSWDDLKGKIHAFSDPDSNSGHLVPRYELAKRGGIPEQYFSKFLFTYSHENVVNAVVQGLVDSGSVDGYIWELLNRNKDSLQNQTRIIHRSDYYGFPPIVTRKFYPKEKVEKFRHALEQMKKNPQGRLILEKFGLDGFQQAQPELFESIQSAQRFVDEFQKKFMADNR